MTASIPSHALGSLHPRDLASRLLDEMLAGMEPVWPSTEFVADLMVMGLHILSAARPEDVAKAITTAPEVAHIDWRGRLERMGL